MASSPPRLSPKKATVQYQNADLTPAYVDGAQGLVTQNGALCVNFYSEYVKPLSEISSQGSRAQTIEPGVSQLTMRHGDPFGLDTDEITIIRRIEASLFMTRPVLESIVPWLQQRLDEIRKREQTNGSS